MIKKSDEEIIRSVLGSAWNSELAKGEKDTFVKNSVVQSYRLAEQSAQEEIEQANKAYDSICNSLTLAGEREREFLSKHNSIVEELNNLGLRIARLENQNFIFVNQSNK